MPPRTASLLTGTGRRKLASTATAAALGGRSSKISVTTITASSSSSAKRPTDDPLQGALEDRVQSLEVDTMGKSWYDALRPEFEKPYFHKLKHFVAQEYKKATIYPPMDEIYSWSRLTPLEAVKVVILGQDPYHNVGQAHGLAFSVKAPLGPPKSLQNIYKQIAADIPGFSIPKSGDLSAVAKNGVLFLNSILTVQSNKPLSHAKKGWELLTEQALRTLIQRKEEANSDHGLVFMAWGIPAKKICEGLKIDQAKHLLLQSAHPSPLSASRGFIGNEHFKKANTWLKEKYGPGNEIDWTVLCR